MIERCNVCGKPKAEKVERHVYEFLAPALFPEKSRLDRSEGWDRTYACKCDGG